MEFSYTKSRSNAPTSFADVIKEQKVGLLILNDGESQSDVAAAKVNVVFNTRNITKSVVQTNPPLSSSSSSNNLGISVESGRGAAAKSPLAVVAGDGCRQETPGTGHSFTRISFVGKPCLLSSNYIISHRMGTNNNSNNPVPLTTCAKHGTAGFLPLDYARRLPEYTCTTHVFPVHRVVHRFEDCVLEFPESLISSNNVVTKCSRCDKELSDRDDIYMSRDNTFCSDECRSEECTSCWSCDTIRNDDDDDDDELSDISSIVGPVVFTIDFF
ncbi:hypothetical protein ACP275_09G112400 [Erythranthe tilingii]